MAYEKTNWVDNETPINATNLNKMEQGIEDAAKTGGILEGTYVEWEADKPIPEGYEKVDDPDAIIKVDMTEILTPKTGFTFLDGNCFKNKNRYFGNVTIQMGSGAFTQNHSLVAGFTKEILNYTNTGCYLCYGQWNTNVVGYCYMSNGGIEVGDKTGSNTYTAVKITFDIVTKETDSIILIRKVGVTPLPEDTTASIVNSKNIEDKEHNTYSAEIIDGIETDINNNINNLIWNTGIGTSVLPSASKIDINDWDWNGFAYLLDCNYGGTSISYGYFLQLNQGSDGKYRVQFFLPATYDGAHIQMRVRIGGTWGAWKVIPFA